MQHSSTSAEQLQRTWLRGGALDPDGHPALVVFPHAGGGASFYRSWLINPDFSVHIVQYPGREDRISEQLPSSLGALADGVAEALLTLGDRPLYLFGHSMGALVAFEVARRLEAAGRYPQLRLCVSSYTAPHLVCSGGLRDLDDDAFIAYGRSATGEVSAAKGQDSAFDVAALRDLVISGMRADFRLVEQYRTDPEPPVDAPILALWGKDEAIDPADMDLWAHVTRGGYRSATFPGGHFYLAAERDAVLENVRQWCSELDHGSSRATADGDSATGDDHEVRDDDVAVIGIAARVPGATNLDEFWANLCAGEESLTHFTDEELLSAGVSPEELGDPRLVRVRPILADVADFDPKFFAYAPSEARSIDPQQRLFLECAWEAVESSGYDLQRYDGSVGVFGGSAGSTYYRANLSTDYGNLNGTEYLQTALATENDFLAPRVSYKLNLRGPSISLGTGCSTSLVAIHLAVQSILSGESDMALAGGASITFPQTAGYVATESGAISTSGRCRAFDASADGTLVGDGVGVILLKRASSAVADGDSILGIIRGTAVNNDGGNKAGFAAPSVSGQVEVITEALAVAEVPAETVDYVETHGTGTLLGDPIEIAALDNAFRQAGDTRTEACRLGTLKPNIGHTGPASGVLALIKVILALQHRMYPPAVNFTAPNPQIEFSKSPFYVGTRLRRWNAPDGKPRRAGVSSYSMGGTNAHAVLQEAPVSQAPTAVQDGPHLLVLSARTAPALEAARKNLARHLEQHPEQDLAAVAATLRIGRRAFKHRFTAVCADSTEARQVLESAGHAPSRTGIASDKPRPVVLLFPGQGSQFSGMGAQLYATSPVYRRHIDECAIRFEPLIGVDLRTMLCGEGDEATDAALMQTRLTQPALFTVGYALTQLLGEWGVQPVAMLGHSIGELVAACVAGVFTLDEAVQLAALRGELIQQCESGAMAAVGASLDAVTAMLPVGVSVAAVNGPEQVVVAGSAEGIEALVQEAASTGVRCTRLPVNRGFHSALVDPAVGRFSAAVARLRLQPPQVPFMSNVTGTWITGAQATDPEYWGRQLRETVQFASGLAVLCAEYPDAVLVEAGPGHTLRGIVAANTQEPEVVSMLGDRTGDSATVAIAAAGRLWAAGAELVWQHFGAPQPRVPLPTYPFERERLWMIPPKPVASRPARQAPAAPAKQVPTVTETAPQADVSPTVAVEQIWCEALGVASVEPDDNFFDLGGDSLIAARIVTAIGERCGIKVSVAELWDQGATLADLVDLVQRRCGSNTNVGEQRQ
ncbi:alpha/beta fold hydrolase [Mycobacteroides chelonae]|uniref:type I polyketide synthase n=1 Tax=Mycobacteroides chelonae TaxID=1774 RepID=UPI00191053D1|nr:type I polyketide synthase [Mycobacteroides chelonae]QQG98015.1 alpha/beta fold hydrolase [Mycobacteroides chelonae]